MPKRPRERLPLFVKISDHGMIDTFFLVDLEFATLGGSDE